MKIRDLNTAIKREWLEHLASCENCQNFKAYTHCPIGANLLDRAATESVGKPIPPKLVYVHS